MAIRPFPHYVPAMDRPPTISTSAPPLAEIDSVVPPTALPPSDRAISDCAYDLYQQSGCVPGRDDEHWFAASDSLRARPPAPVPAAAPNLPFETAEPRRDAPAPHALGYQAGRAAYTLNGSQASPIFSPTGPPAP